MLRQMYYESIQNVIDAMQLIAEFRGQEGYAPIPLDMGGTKVLLKLEPVEQVVHTMPDTEIKGTNGKPVEEAEPTDF